MTREAYGGAYLDGFGRTRRLLISWGVSPGVADEIAQAAWARGWERIRSLRDAPSVQTWVNSIALNLFRNQLRAVRASHHHDSAEGAAAPRIEGASRVDVRRILSWCSAEERELLRRYYVEGYTSKELARVAGCHPVTVRVRVMRAKRRLQQLVGISPKG